MAKVKYRATEDWGPSLQRNFERLSTYSRYEKRFIIEKPSSPFHEYPKDDGVWSSNELYKNNCVCFDCRYVARKNLIDGRGSFLCPTCRKKLIPLNLKSKIPKKTDDKSWERMRAMYECPKPNKA